MKIYRLIILALISISTFSCEEYYFSHPIPSDSKNLLSIPRKYQGSWIIKDENNPSDTTSSEKLIIGENFYNYVIKLTEKISKDSISKDSNLLIIDNKFYQIKNDELTGGHNCYLENDTVVIKAIIHNITQLGQNSYLRKFKYGYILNIKNEKVDGWWKLKFIDTRYKKGFVVRELNRIDFEILVDKPILHKKFDNYFNINWTSNELIDFIDNGGFSDSTITINLKEKINN